MTEEEEERVEPWPPPDHASLEVFAKQRQQRRAARRTKHPSSLGRRGRPGHVDLRLGDQSYRPPKDPPGAIFCGACGQLAPDEIPFVADAEGERLTCPRLGCDATVRHRPLNSEAEILPRARPGFAPIACDRDWDWGVPQRGARWAVGDRRRGIRNSPPRQAHKSRALPDELLPPLPVDPGGCPRPLSDLGSARPTSQCVGCGQWIQDLDVKPRWTRIRSGGIDLGKGVVDACHACWPWIPAEVTLAALESGALLQTPALATRGVASAAVRAEAAKKKERAAAEAREASTIAAEDARARIAKAQAKKAAAREAALLAKAEAKTVTVCERSGCGNHFAACRREENRCPKCGLVVCGWCRRQNERHPWHLGKCK